MDKDTLQKMVLVRKLIFAKKLHYTPHLVSKIKIHREYMASIEKKHGIIYASDYKGNRHYHKTRKGNSEGNVLSKYEKMSLNVIYKFHINKLNLETTLLNLIGNGKRIIAIKKIREEKGLGLKDAKDYLEIIERFI